MLNVMQSIVLDVSRIQKTVYKEMLNLEGIENAIMHCAFNAWPAWFHVKQKHFILVAKDLLLAKL